MILDDIVSYKRQEVDHRQKLLPMAALLRLVPGTPVRRHFKSSISGETIHLIAEIKKASPSKGLLCPGFNPAALARTYERAGAAAISVLTEEKFFQGSLEHLRDVKAETRTTPLLRKDFIIDPYQLLESLVYGADAVLLIVAALSQTELQLLLKEAVAMGLAPLVEIHNRIELERALDSGAEIIGINNRDLKTFEVSLETTFTLLRYIPAETIVVSESGIRGRKDVEEMEKAGVNAILVGESIVTAASPETQIRRLLGRVS